MGQKINPIGFRLAVNRNWSSKWYANSRNFAPMLAEDIKVRTFLKGKLARPELFRLLADSHPGDVLLVEHVDRLSRLDTADWDRLKVELKARKVRVVALDLPTTWAMATKAVAKKASAIANA